jgi:MYXO-CTERM domain-containing protein
MDTLIITAVTQPLGGTAVTNGHQTLTFQPAPNFYGVTGFRYTVADRQGLTASATVVVTVTPTDDPPIARDDGFFVTEVPSAPGCQAGGVPAGGALVVLIAGLMVAWGRQRRRALARGPMPLR